MQRQQQWSSAGNSLGSYSGTRHHSARPPRDRRFDNDVRWTRLDPSVVLGDGLSSLPCKKQHVSCVRKTPNGSTELVAFWGGDENGLSGSTLRLKLETMEMEKHQLEVMPVDALLEEEDPPESPIRPTASMGYAVDPVKHLHYFFGGIFKGTDPLTGKVIKFLSNRLHVYNSETEELEVLQEDPASPMPSPRISAALTFVPALRKISATPMLYLFGGNDGSASSCESLGEFWSFNLETRFWHRIHEYDPICGLREGLTMDYWKRPDDGDHNRSSKSTMESPSVHFLALYGGSTGEKNGNFKHRDLLLYDIVKDKFSKPSCQVSPPLGRCYHSSFLLGSRLVIFGGWQQTPEALNHYYDKSANHYKVTNSLCSITLGTDFVKYNDLGRDLPDSSKPCPRTTQSMTLCNRVGLLFGGIREEMIDGSAKNSPLSDIWVLEVGAPVRAISLVLNRDTLVWEDPLSWIPSRTYRILIGKDPAKYPDAASSRKEVVYEGKNTSWKVQGLQEGVSYMATLDIVTPTAVTEGSNACFFLHIEPPKPPSEIQSSISGDAFYFSWPRIPGCRYVVDVKVASLATDRLESRYSRKDKDKEEISSFAFEHDAGTADTWHGSVEQIKSRLSPTFRSTRIQLVVRVLAVNRFKEASEWSAPSELILDLTPEVVIMPSAVREPLAKATQLKAPLRKPGTLDAVDVEMEEILVEGSSVRPQETFDSMEVVEELVTEGVSARPVGDVTEVMKGSSVLPVEEEISSGMSEPPRKPKPKKTVKINRTSAHQPSPPKADQKPLVKIQKSLAEANKTRKSDEMKEPQSATKPMKRLKKKRDASLDLPSSSQVNNGNGPASSSSALALKIGPAQKEVVEERTAKQGPAPMDIDNLDLTKDSEVSDPPSEADLFRTKEDAILADVSSTSKVISTALPSSSSEPAPDVRQVLASPKKANVSISPVVPEKRMSSPVRSSRSLQSDKDLAKELFGSDESLPTAVSKASESIKQKIPKAKAKLAPPKKAVAFGKLRTEKITSTDEDSEEMSDLESSPSEPDEEEPRSPEYTEESVIKKVKKSLKTPVKKAKAAPKKPVAAKKKKRNREDDLLVFAPRTDYDYDAAQAKFKAQLMDPTKGLAYNLKYGDPCQVFWCGRWYHARAVCYAHASADTLLLKVNYNGWEARYDSYIIVDERVNEDVVRPDEVDIGETRPARSEARLQFDVTGRGAKSHHGLKNADQVKSVVEDGYLLIPLKQKAETVHPYDYNGAEDDETTDDDA